MLDTLNTIDRYIVMTQAIKRYPFDLIVIDGIAKLQRNTNDLEESDALVALLMVEGNLVRVTSNKVTS